MFERAECVERSEQGGKRERVSPCTEKVLCNYFLHHL